MSKPAPQKPNFVTTLLWSFVIFAALNLFFNRPQEKVQPETIDQLYATLHNENAARLDVTIATKTFPEYQKALDELVQEKKLTAAQAEAKKIEAVVLVADTQLKAGIHANDTNRVRSAFYTLVSYQRHLLNQPAWNTAYRVTDVTGDPKFGWREWSGQQLYEKVRDTLAARNQTELVWGFIPGYQIIDFLVGLTGRIPNFSYAFAGFLLAFLVRAIVYPLSQKQMMYGRQMSQLGPLVKEIKDQYKDDQMTANQKVMELYKEYGVNPMAGCLPMFIQLPFFLGIYQCMLRYQFTFEKGTFLWINPSSSISTHGFIAANLGQQDVILTLIYGVTMLASTLLTPVSDPTQVKTQRLMGIGLAVMWTGGMLFGAVPVVAGFVLYWTFTNILSTAQMLRSYRLPLPPLVKVNAKGGGVYPEAPKGRWASWYEEMQRQAAEQTKKNNELRNNLGKDNDSGRNNNGSKDHGSDHGGSNGSANGKPKPTPPTVLGTGETQTGTPQKHKPKKRK